MERPHSTSLVSVSTTLVVMLLVLVSATAMAQSNAVPFVNQPLVPAGSAPGSAAFTLTVTGTGFVSGAIVNWNGSARATTFVSSSSLQASITAADVASKGTATITVVNPAPGGGISNRVFFPVRSSLPSVAAAVDGKFIGVTGASTSVAGDFNNDGKQDVVVGVSNSDGTGTLTYYRGNGAGSFIAATTTTSDIPIAFLLAGDFNDDGNLDFLVGDDGANFASQAAVFLGDGHGHFTEKTLFGQGTGDFGGPVAVGDFNGDGKLDVLYFCETQGVGALWVLLGNGDGTFQGPQVAKSLQTVSGGTAVGDFNGDGKLDVAIGNGFGSGSGTPIQIFLGNGDGSFTAGALYTATESSIAAADVNGDGKLDLIFSGTNGSNVIGLCVLLGNGDGTFTSGGSCVGPGGSGVLLADFNGDGKLDVAAQGNPASIYLGNGDGTFQGSISLPYTTGNGGVPFGVADFTGNGELDFVFPYTAATGGPTVLLQTTLSISAASLNFGLHRVGFVSAPQTVTLTNIGTTRLTVSSIALSGADPGDFIAQNNCTPGIKAGGSCTIKVYFKPTADGTRTASVNISDSGVSSPQAVALTGTGTH